MEQATPSFLVDVGVGRAVENYLAEHGYGVKAVRSLDPAMADLDIIRLAASEGRMVLTMDKDFGELVYHAGEQHGGVLLLRMEDACASEKVAAVAYILEHYAEAMEPGRFCVYRHGHLRIRRPPDRVTDEPVPLAIAHRSQLVQPMPAPTTKSPLSAEPLDGIFVHVNAEHMPQLPCGPFARQKDGRIFSVSGHPAQGAVSDDEGATWEPRVLFDEGNSMSSSPTGGMTVTAAGTVVVGFANLGERELDWDEELHDSPNAKLPTYAMRSLDGGETWQDLQKLHDEWTGATRCMIQTSAGRVVFASMKMLHDPGRHSVMAYGSDDDGKTWEPSNVIDLGGNGHHGGVTEGTFVELRDGRLYQLIRTNWGQFWRAESTDGGKHWHPYGPAGIDASSAPGQLKRLASGRIVLLWNRLYPEGESRYKLNGGDGNWSATPVSNFRKELSISFSEDECQTWSPPIVIARNPEREVSYPYVFEAQPGELWITAHRWNLRMRLREEDFLG